MPVFNNILAGSSGQSTGYDIPYSIKTINGDRITRTMTETGAATPYFTYSTWFKKSDPDTSQFFLWWRATAIHANAVVELAHNSSSVWRFNLWTGSASEANRYSTEKYRDPSAWYHWVVQWNGATFAMYMNNELVAMSTTGNINGNSWGLQSGNEMRVASSDAASSTLGYTAESYFIEGQTLAPSNFAELNEDTGQWVPKEYEGTFSGNSFYLDYADSSDLGKDVSGLGNDFTTSGSIDANSQTIDTPTNNYCTMNPLGVSDYNKWTFSEGNLKAVNSSDGFGEATFQLSSGKWYFEVDHTDAGGKNGLIIALVGPNDNYIAGSFDVRLMDGLGTGLYGVSIDMDAGSFATTLNGSASSSGSFTSQDCKIAFVNGNSANAKTFIANFGQDSSFAGARTAQGNGGTGEDFFYTPPTGYKALNTDNLPNPAIALPTDHFNTVLYSGNGGTNSITGTGFSPDLVWNKSRDGSSGHDIYDSVRGVEKSLASDETTAEVDRSTGLQSFDSDGFTTGDYIRSNYSGRIFVSWNWKAGGTASSNTDGSITSSVSANTDAGFSIVGWTGDTTSATIGHGLSQAPELIIIKSRDGPTGSYNWPSYSKPTGTGGYINLDQSNAWTSNAGFYGTAPTASVFSPGSHSYVSGAFDFIAYCFHSVEGYSKVGTFTGNNSVTDNAFVYTGFKPAFLLVKNTGASGQYWTLWDNKRDPYNVANHVLEPNDSRVEQVNANTSIDLLSNGFKPKNNNAQCGGYGSFLYYAVAESPFKTSNAR